MKGYIKYNEDETSQAFELISKIDNCLGLPEPDTKTYQEFLTAFCKLDAQSAATQFWGSVIKIDTDKLGNCLTAEELSKVIQLPDDVYICGTNMPKGD